MLLGNSLLGRLLLRPLFDGDGDLPPAGDLPPRPAKKLPLVCEHCECTLTPTGDVLRMSDKARGHNKASEKLATLESKVATLETELRDARAKLQEYATVRESKFDLHL